MFKGLGKIFDEVKKKQKELFDLEGKETDTDNYDSSDNKGTKNSLRTYYLLYKQTRGRFFPQLEGYKYSQVLGFINNTYFPRVLALQDFNLKKLQSTYPITLVFITPRKKAIALFAIYSGAIAEEVYSHPPPTKYDEFAEFIKISDPLMIRQYVKGRLLMYKMVTPFRIVAGIEVAGNQNERLIDGELLEFIQTYTTPSGVFKDLYNIAKESGIAASVQFAYTLAHASDRLSKAIKSEDNVEAIKQIITHIMKKRKGETQTQDFTESIPKPKPIEQPSKIPPPPPGGAPSVQDGAQAGMGSTQIKYKFCPHCGKELPPNSKFCPHCGKKLI